MDACANCNNCLRSSVLYSLLVSFALMHSELEFSDDGDITFFSPAENKRSTLDDLPVDLHPEGGEVVDGGRQREEHHEPDRYAGDHFHGEDVIAKKWPLTPTVGEDDGHHRDDLNQHLEFPKLASLNGEALGSGNRAKSAD